MYLLSFLDILLFSLNTEKELSYLSTAVALVIHKGLLFACTLIMFAAHFELAGALHPQEKNRQ